MRLPFFRRKTDDSPPPPPRRRSTPAAEAPPAAADDAVAQARTRARRRLVGALVLLAVGVIGFPLLFETQPRPLPLDTPIELSRRDAGTVPPVPVPAPVVARAERPLPVPPPDAGQEVAPAAPAASAAPASAAPVPPAPAASRVAAARPESVVAPVVVPPAPRAAAPASAPAAPAPAPAGRFVVQVGAYTDAGTLRDTRAKVEKLGFKTYTQVIEAEGGKPRTRVRVGPFATREEADAAAARLKRSGLPGAILTL